MSERDERQLTRKEVNDQIVLKLIGVQDPIANALLLIGLALTCPSDSPSGPITLDEARTRGLDQGVLDLVRKGWRAGS